MANRNGHSLSSDVQKIDLHEFVTKRAHEMEAMLQSSRDVKENQRIIQKLPRHMRRRAASHDVRRLPLALRAAASREAKKSGNPRASKRPSRRYRRRPRNLLLAYARRKRKHVWLETHIWHAKRFHMTERWGYKIPLHSNERGVRAAFRSAAEQCLILDLSYYCCIQLTGLETDILEGLRRLTCSSNDSTVFASRKYIDGTKEGRCSIYKDGSYPKSVLGEVTFMWKPIGQLLSNETVLSPEKEAASSKNFQDVEEVIVDSNINRPKEKQLVRAIWIWTHPSTYSLILNEIKNVFSMQAASVEDTQSDISDLPKYPCGTLFTNGSITLESLKDELCRFKLIGHQSLAVLQEALSLTVPEAFSESTVDTEIDGVPCKRLKYSEESVNTGSEPMKQSWWGLFCSDEKNVQEFKELTETWSSLQSIFSPAELTPNSIYGLTVRDPRLFLPQKKTLSSEQSGFGNVNSGKICETILPSTCRSAIWDKSTRAEVARNKMSTSDLNDLRSNYIVPGTKPELGSRESHIPILLVQNPGVRSSNSEISRPSFGCGFDLIIPAGWSTAFWISLIYRRAQPAGLREHCSVTFESGQLLSPESHPDSPSGEEMNVIAYREHYAKYCRMPPAKRCNHVKMGVAAPFHFPWKDLVSQWQARTGIQKNDISESFYVLRHRQYLRQLNNRIQCRGFDSRQQGESITSKRGASLLNSEESISIKQRVSRAKPSRPIILLRRPGLISSRSFVSNKDLNLKSASNVELARSSDLDALRNEPCLVPVHIRLSGKGAPSRYSMICIPAAGDLSASSVALNPAGPVEPKRKIDKNNKPKTNTQLRSCTKDKQNTNEQSSEIKETSATDVKQKIPKKRSVKLKPAKKISKDFGTLSLPVCENIVESCSRLVIGYVVEGGFSHAPGCVKGLGFVSLQGLLTLLDSQNAGEREIVVLVRTNTSYQYRRAILTVNVDFTS